MLEKCLDLNSNRSKTCKSEPRQQNWATQFTENSAQHFLHYGNWPAISNIWQITVPGTDRMSEVFNSVFLLSHMAIQLKTELWMAQNPAIWKWAMMTCDVIAEYLEMLTHTYGMAWKARREHCLYHELTTLKQLENQVRRQINGTVHKLVSCVCSSCEGRLQR